MTKITKPMSKRSQIKQFAHTAWDNEGGTVPALKPQPYRTTPIFDEVTLPKGLRKKHQLASGVWGIIRVLEGRVNYTQLEPLSTEILDSKHQGHVTPNQAHLLEIIGAVRLKVEFYNENPFAPA